MEFCSPTTRAKNTGERGEHPGCLGVHSAVLDPNHGGSPVSKRGRELQAAGGGFQIPLGRGEEEVKESRVQQREPFHSRACAASQDDAQVFLPVLSRC